MSLPDLSPRFTVAGRLAHEHSVSDVFLENLRRLLLQQRTPMNMPYAWLLVGQLAHTAISVLDVLPVAPYAPNFHSGFDVEAYPLFMLGW